MITLHRSNRLDLLDGPLCDLLARPLPDAITPEIVSVQSLAMRAWLEMRIAARLGVCANLRFPFPRDLVGELLRAVLDDNVRSLDPFQPEALAWSILEILPSLLARPEFEPLSRYLAGEESGESHRRFQLARRIADTFDQYVLFRPEMILGWDEGRDQGPDGPLTDADCWQIELWRALVERHGRHHAAACVQRFCKLAPNAAHRLPRRIFLFGISALPPLYLDLLSAVPDSIEIHLFLHELSPAQKTQLAAGEKEPEDGGNDTLSVLGRHGRGFGWLLRSRARTSESGQDLFADPLADGAPPTLLRVLQTGVFHDRSLTGVPAADGSLAFHSCHGRLREVEVLHDQLLDLFEKDPTLVPGDVAVLAPDIEEYASLIDAVFGAPEGPGRIPYAIAGRPLGATSSLLEAFFSILRLPERRHTLAEIFNLLSLDPVRQKFSLSPDEVETLRRLAPDAGIRWGRDAAHRAEHGQPALPDFTFRHGLDRLLLGVAMPKEQMFGGVTPCAGPEGKEAQVLGRLSEFCRTLFAETASLGSPRTPARWRQDLEQMLERLLARQASTDEDSANEERQLRQALLEFERRAQAAGFTGVVDLATTRDALAADLSSRPGKGRFFSGGVTFSSLLHLRGIPFRVICLLGMGDTDFPRAQGRAGFDLLARHPRPGDRNVRDDDLSQFLEAALAASERLLVIYPGQGIRDNQPRPPSVAAAALVDPLPPDTRQAIEVRHPLQPFSRRYFDASDERLFSYDTRYLEGARAARASRIERRLFLQTPLGEPAGATVALDELCDFFGSPLERFLRQRLQIRFFRLSEEEPEREPLELDKLQQYQVREWLLERAGEGPEADREEQILRLRASGMLPPGRLGEAAFGKLVSEIDPVVAEYRKRVQEERPRRIEVDVEASGLRLVGVLDGVFGDTRIFAAAGKRDGKRLLGQWIRHLAQCCMAKAPRQSVLVFFCDEDAADTVELPTVPDAAAHLSRLLRVYLRGQTRPLPFFPKASFEYARIFLKRDHDRAMQEARKKFLGTPGQPPEVEPIREYVRCAFGSEEAALEAPDFAPLALEVFQPLLRAAPGVAS